MCESRSSSDSPGGTPQARCAAVSFARQSQKAFQAHLWRCCQLLALSAAGCYCLLLPCLHQPECGPPEKEEAAARLLQAQASRHRCLAAAHLWVGLGQMCRARSHAKAEPHLHGSTACSTGAQDLYAVWLPSTHAGSFKGMLVCLLGWIDECPFVALRAPLLRLQGQVEPLAHYSPIFSAGRQRCGAILQCSLNVNTLMRAGNTWSVSVASEISLPESCSFGQHHPLQTTLHTEMQSVSRRFKQYLRSVGPGTSKMR